MKTFRVRETYKIRGWTYVKAEDKHEAEEIISLDISEVDFREEEREHMDIQWGSLEEVKE